MNEHDFSSLHRIARLALALGPCRTCEGLRRAVMQFNGGLNEKTIFNEIANITDKFPDAQEGLARIGRVLERLDREGAMVLLGDDPAYPEALMRLPDAPSVLFVRGELPRCRMVGLVGARAASTRGMAAARRLAGALVEMGVGVVSGGAIGIDASAHEGALDAGGLTLAVLGSGLFCPYPERNIGLFDRIRRQGAVVSSFAPEAPPLAGHFPRRNRLIAAFSSVLCVAEAGFRSGALHTARWARRLGIPVAVLPGSPGCNHLLMKGAFLVQDADDVIALAEGRTLAQPGPETVADPSEVEVLAAFGEGPTTLDSLASRLRWSPARTAAVLIRLEVQGWVSALPGGLFQAVPRVQAPP